MHGLGNDFIILDARPLPGHRLDLSAATLCNLADRRTGIGFDQAIVILPATAAQTDATIRFFNADGSESGACGNGSRCVADLLMQETGKTQIKMAIGERVLEASRTDDGLIAVDMGVPHFGWQQIPLAEAVDTRQIPLSVGLLRQGLAVNVGNPHLVFFVADCAAVPLETLGPLLEHDRLFPQRTNVEAAQIIDSQTIRLRVWERGVGLTRACGTGACATLVAAVERGLTERRAEIRLDGGSLWVEWRDDGHIIMSGPSTLVFHGQIDLSRHG